MTSPFQCSAGRRCILARGGGRRAAAHGGSAKTGVVGSGRLTMVYLCTNTKSVPLVNHCPKGPSFVSPRLFASLSFFSLAIVRQAASPTWCPNAVTTINSPPVPRISTTTSLSLSLSPPLLKDLYTHTRRFAIFLFFPSNLGTSLQRRSATTPPCSRLQGFSCLRRWCSHS